MNSPTANPLIELRSLVKVYNSLAGSVTALNGVNLQVFQGEFLVITGKSGSGKTTLVNVLTGLDRATSGEIWVDGAPLHRFDPEKAAKLRGRTIFMVTHDKDIAKRGSRMITLSDGEIVGSKENVHA